jgi:MraZ protein
MFLGRYEHSLDEKNRVVLPLGLRKDLSPETLARGFVLVAGTRLQFLELHPMAEWEKHEQTLDSSCPTTLPGAEDYLIDVHWTVVNVELDKQFRFILPDSSKDLAGIVRDVYFIGMGKKIILYGKERWEERQKERKDFMVPPVLSKG